MTEREDYSIGDLTSFHSIFHHLPITMKLKLPTFDSSKFPGLLTPPAIPLQREPMKTQNVQDKRNYVTLKLRTNPTVASSPTYDRTVKYFETGTPEEWLFFNRDLKEVSTGQNVRNAAGKFALARMLLQGDALAIFENQVLEARKKIEKEQAQNQDNDEAVLDLEFEVEDALVETEETFTRALQAVGTNIFPQGALRVQKRYMRKFMKKPKKLTIRQFATRTRELNGYLDLFPPYNCGQSLPEDELIDIFEAAIPPKWQKVMMRNNWDPADHSLHEFVEFCERLEVTEDQYHEARKPPAKEQRSNSNGKEDKPYKGPKGASHHRKRKYEDKQSNSNFKK